MFINNVHKFKIFKHLYRQYRIFPYFTPWLFDLIYEFELERKGFKVACI